MVVMEVVTAEDTMEVDIMAGVITVVDIMEEVIMGVDIMEVITVDITADIMVIMEDIKGITMADMDGVIMDMVGMDMDGEDIIMGGDGIMVGGTITMVGGITAIMMVISLMDTLIITIHHPIIIMNILW